MSPVSRSARRLPREAGLFAALAVEPGAEGCSRMAFIIRSLPMGNNLVTNILTGGSRIPALPFFAGACPGYIAQNFIFALLGSGVGVDPFWRTVISVALFVIASPLGLWLYRRHRTDVESMTRPGQEE